MKMRAATIALSSLLFAPQAGAQTAPQCGPVRSALTSLAGYQVAIPATGPEAGWYVLDGAGLRAKASGWPDIEADRFRLRQFASEVDLDLQGLPAAPGRTDR